MNDDFRQRAFLPVILPFGVIAGLAVLLFSLSRVLLAVPEIVSTFTALLAAGYVLLVAALIASRPRISSSAMGLGLALGLVAVVAAGALAQAAGMRDLHADELAAPDDDAPAEAEEGAPEGALVWVAVDIAYEQAPSSAEAGELTFFLDNQGGIFHDVVIEEAGDVEVVGAEGGQTDTGTITLEAGTYTYYCSVPGHREAGMVGTMEVS
jgi:plastocyanin